MHVKDVADEKVNFCKAEKEVKTETSAKQKKKGFEVKKYGAVMYSYFPWD